jgi:MFS family permease
LTERGAQLLPKAFINAPAFASLIVARIIYAANFYNIAGIFSFVAADLKENVGGLGLLSSGFLLGIALFQIPGGVFAARAGPRKAATFGTLLASGAVTLTAVSPEFVLIVVLRFFAGFGMAFVFGPGIALSARYFRKGSEGLAVGIYNSLFSLGTVIGLSGWVVIAELVGWRLALLIGGVLGIITGVILFVLLPPDPDPEDFRVRLPDLRTILLDRKLLLIGFGLLGISTALSIVNSFVTYYLLVTLSVAPVYASAVADLTWISSLIVSLASGRIYDRVRGIRELFLIAAILSFVGLAVISYPDPYAAVGGAILVGSGVGIASTVAFSTAREAGRGHPRYESLSIAWVNMIGYLGSFWTTLIFSFLALTLGYGYAWLLISLVIIPFLLPILLVRLDGGPANPPRR